MKSNFLKTILIALLPICAVSCIDNVPEEEVLPTDPISFEYYIDQKADKYFLDFYVDSEITFVNTSPTEGEAEWDFDGDGATDAVGDVVSYAFSKAGTHYVQLSIADLALKQVVMIAPIKPLVTIKYPENTSICEVRSTPITFEVELPNPKNKEAIFKWTFPTDTKYADGTTDATTFEAKYFTNPNDSVIPLPEALKFWHVGSQEVKLEVILGGEPLEAVIKNVPVAFNQEVPTLYYAVQGGRIMAYKLTNGKQPDDMNIAPFDLGVSSGQHPFNLLFQDSLLYVLDAGKQFYYVNDANGVLGDGKISVISKDGSKVQTMISNVGQAAFDDPFYGFIEGANLFYANRNTGIVKVPLKDRDKMYSASEYPYYVQHATLGYYNNGWGYGAIGGVFAKIKGVWHWAKFYNGNGIYRFEDADILPAAIAAGDETNVPFYDEAQKASTGVMLSGMKPRSFVYTGKSATPKFCVHIKDDGDNGFYVGTYDEIVAVGSSKNALKPYLKTYNGKSFVSNTTGNLPAVEGHGDESVGICQMAYDEVNDCVYFGYRNNSVAKDLYPATGIYRYNIATDQIDCLIEGPSVYGLVVNNTPAKLF